jgi:DNA-binding MarR family transcriptional regulator
MESTELKFLLKLLDCPSYRSPLTASRFKDLEGKDKKKDKYKKICQDLGKDGLVDFSREIAAVQIAPPGRALLEMTTDQLPISTKELKVLQKIGKAAGKIAPSKISISSVKAAERDKILQSFRDRGLVEVETKLKKTKAEVWLTDQGQECLDLVNKYFQSLRKSSGTQLSPPPADKPTDKEILQDIRDLDQQLGTRNYLPIFYLRQKLEPPLSREDLDQALYRLEGSKQIELSALVEASRYSQEQFNAGIKQRSGSRLFFIKATVN